MSSARDSKHSPAKVSIHLSIHTMPAHASMISQLLSQGPMASRQLSEILGINQPTVSRAISGTGDEIVRISAGPSIQYALRDALNLAESFMALACDDERFSVNFAPCIKALRQHLDEARSRIARLA